MTNEKRKMKNEQPLKVALVHDWLVGGGAELVVEQLHKIYPYAPIYTSYCTPEWRERLDNKVVTGYLQHLGKVRKFIPFLRIWWFQSLKLDDYDLVISSSGAEAKGVILGTRKLKLGNRRRQKSTKPLHIAYIHAPTHYYWSRYNDYLKNPGFGVFNPLARLGLKLLVSPLRKWDYKASQRPDRLIANSTHTQAEIKKYYNRDSTVIHPPVNTDRFASSKFLVPSSQRSGFVITGRQVPYKRIDLAVRACTELDLPLTVVGDGPEHQSLKKLAGPSITFVGAVSNEEVVRYVSSAEAFIFPGLDDFGIAPVEALASGTPVIVYKAGGALDYVIPGKTGEFFTEQTVDSLKTALQSFDSKKYDQTIIKSKAKEFSIEKFTQKTTDIIHDFCDNTR